MDPNATLARIEQTTSGYLADDLFNAECYELLDALFGWLESGGFEPSWSDHPTGAAAYRRFAADING